MKGMYEGLFGDGNLAPFRPMVRLPQAEAIKLAETSKNLAELARKLAEIAVRIADPDVARELLAEANHAVDEAVRVGSAVQSVIQSAPFSLAPDV